MAKTDYTQLYGFGDSLTDTGSYAGRDGASQEQTGWYNRFTTNPGGVLTDRLAAYYGLSSLSHSSAATGTNYAQSGSTIASERSYAYLGLVGDAIETLQDLSQSTQYQQLQQRGLSSLGTLVAALGLTLPSGQGPGGGNGSGGGTDMGNKTIQGQVESALSNHGGHLDPDALYLVWGGLNDVVQDSIAAYAVNGLSNSLGLGSTANIGEAMTTLAQQQASNIKQLQDAGARYIIVGNLQDLGQAPLFRNTAQSIDAKIPSPLRGLISADGLTAGAAAATSENIPLYNEALFNELRAQGVNYIPLDVYGLYNEFLTHPAAFGIRNTVDRACSDGESATGTQFNFTCTPKDYVAADADTSYVWSDNAHPTSGVHHMLSQATISMLEAPRLQKAMNLASRNAGLGRADQVARHVMDNPQDGFHLWGGLSANYQGNRGDNGYGGATPAGLIGLDLVSNHWVYGGFLGYGHQRNDFGHDMGQYRSDDTTLGAFTGWYGTHAWANAQASYSWQKYDIRREAALGPQTPRFSSSPDGSNLTLAVNAGYQWQLEGKGQVSHGPIAGLNYQNIKRDGYAEQYNPMFKSIALGYQEEDVSSLIGKLGWRVQGHAGGGEPYAELSYAHEYRDQFGKGQEASARSIAVPVAGYYRVPGLQVRDSYLNSVLGVRFEKGGVQGDLALSSLLDNDALQNTTVYLTLNKAF